MTWVETKHKESCWPKRNTPGKQGPLLDTMMVPLGTGVKNILIYEQGQAEVPLYD